MVPLFSLGIKESLAGPRTRPNVKGCPAPCASLRLCVVSRGSVRFRARGLGRFRVYYFYAPPPRLPLPRATSVVASRVAVREFMFTRCLARFRFLFARAGVVVEP